MGVPGFVSPASPLPSAGPPPLVAPAGSAPSAAARAAASLQIRSRVTSKLRVRVRVRTNARSIRVRFVIGGSRIKTVTRRVHKRGARIALPTTATSVRVRARATGKLRATRWHPVAIPSRWPGDVAPAAEVVSARQAQMLALVNELRRTGRTCPGNVWMPPTAALVSSPALDDAARRQSRRMATTGRLSHAGAAGASVGTRLRAAGYPWSHAAETVAAGRALPEATLAQWLGSAGHCRALLAAEAAEAGIAYTYSTTSTYRHFWTVDLARP